MREETRFLRITHDILSFGTVISVLNPVAKLSYNSADVYSWNSLTVNVDKNPACIWDWQDMQFLCTIGQ